MQNIGTHDEGLHIGEHGTMMTNSLLLISLQCLLS